MINFYTKMSVAGPINNTYRSSSSSQLATSIPASSAPIAVPLPSSSHHNNSSRYSSSFHTNISASWANAAPLLATSPRSSIHLLHSPTPPTSPPGNPRNSINASYYPAPTLEPTPIGAKRATSKASLTGGGQQSGVRTPLLLAPTGSVVVGRGTQTPSSVPKGTYGPIAAFAIIINCIIGPGVLAFPNAIWLVEL